MNLFEYHRVLAEQPFFNDNVTAMFVTSFPTSVVNMLRRTCTGYYNKYHKRDISVILNPKTKIWRIHCRTTSRLLFIVKEKK
jgi:hypothetical protein